jgi:transposase
MFQDEGRFGRINIPRSCWAPEYCRPEVGCQIVREYTHVYAAVCPHDGVMDSLILPDADGASMSIFLREVAKRHEDECVIMVMDGAGWHRSEDLDIPANIKIIHLPPYSPQLNPVEHIWDEVREKWFSNKVFKSLTAVENLLVESLKSLETSTDLVKSLCGFKWIVKCKM